MPPLDKLLWKNLHVKGCVWTAWHKRGQQAEKSVTLTAVRAVHLTLNYGQNFFQVQLLVEIIGISIRGWSSSSSITDAIFLNNREKNWLRANNLSLQIAYYWAEVNAMAFCWITFFLINDSLSEKISPGKFREGWWGSVSVMMEANGRPHASLCQDISGIQIQIQIQKEK